VRRIVVGISGASGSVYGIRALERLAGLDDVETHLVVTAAGRLTLDLETDLRVSDLEDLADHVHSIKNVAAPIASGSFRTAGMIVAPCSMRVLSAVAHAASSDLLTRAADVMLKERRPLVLMVRETPLHLGHLRLMAAAAELGAVVHPPMPALYTRPQSLDEVIDHSVARALEHLGIAADDIARWDGPERRTPDEP
jgi:4-hydroxy-3-polyprenylbenzoate decarboxylase